MKNNITELVFILDRSGSMCGLEHDTIGGFNALIEKQKKLNGKCYVTTVLFDNEVETAGRIGIRPERAATYRADHLGTAKNYEAIDCAVTATRCRMSFGKEWKQCVDEDYNGRK